MQSDFLSKETQEQIIALAREKGVSAEDLIQKWIQTHQANNTKATFFEAGEYPFVIIDLEGNVTEINSAFAQSLGYSSDELINQTALDLVAPEDLSIAEDAIAQLAQNPGTTRTVMVHIVSKTSEIKTVVWQAIHINGFIYAVGSDITQNVQKEQYTQQLIEEFKALLDSNQDLIARVNLRLQYEYVNPAWENVMGVSKEDCIGNSLITSTPEIQTLEAYIQQVLQENREINVELPVSTEWGERVLNIRLIPEKLHERIISILIVCKDITLEHIAFQALRASEERYRGIVENQLDLVCRYTPDTILTYVNNAYANYFNKRKDELIGKSFLRLIEPDQIPIIQERIDEVLQNPAPTLKEYSLVVNSEKRWIEWIDQGILDEHGNVIELQAVGRDITQLRQTEVKLDQQEANYRLIFTDNPMPMWVFDLETLKFIAVNKVAIASYQYSEEEFLSKTILDIRPESEIPQTLNVLNEIRNNPHHHSEIKRYSKHRHKKKSGEIIDVAITGRSIIFNGQKGRLILAQDITEQLKMERGIRESEEMFRTMLESAAEGIVLLNHENQIVLVNQYIEEKFGYTRGEILDSSVTLLVPSNPENPSIFHSKHQQQDTQSTYNIEQNQDIFGKHKDGSLFPIEVKFTPITVAEQALTMCFIIDITERKQLEQERFYAKSLKFQLEKEREIIELKEKFISTVSHEFRTPLAVIQSSTEIIRRYGERLSTERTAEKLDTILRQISRMTNLLNNVLLVSKGNSNRLDINLTQLDIVYLSNSIINDIIIMDGEATIIADIALESPHMIGDERLIEHILYNLLSNAVKYSPENTAVYFKIEEDDNSIIFSIIDQGRGIPESDLEHLFKPFYRAKNAHDVQGTGLGLVIVAQSVGLHQGKIDFRTQVNEGTTFIITLPKNGPKITESDRDSVSK